jgi:hypothetical protein
MKRGLGGVLVREEGMGGRNFFLTKGCKELSGGSHNWVIFGRCRVSAQLFFLSRGGEHGGPRRDAHRRQRRRICRKRSGRLLHGRGEAVQTQEFGGLLLHLILTACENRCV